MSRLWLYLGAKKEGWWGTRNEFSQDAKNEKDDREENGNRKQGAKVDELTFSNFSMVRLSIPPHL